MKIPIIDKFTDCSASFEDHGWGRINRRHLRFPEDLFSKLQAFLSSSVIASATLYCKSRRVKGGKKNGVAELLLAFSKPVKNQRFVTYYQHI
jgi:hypothetical protein